jgi:hypothetical protein
MLISVFTADLFKGKNYSDVGVPMYSESNRAFFIGLIIYLVLISIGFFAWQKLTDLRKYFGAVYVVVNVLFFAVFYHFLMWVTD